jgi:hypothetical protein
MQQRSGEYLTFAGGFAEANVAKPGAIAEHILAIGGLCYPFVLSSWRVFTLSRSPFQLPTSLVDFITIAGLFTKDGNCKEHTYGAKRISLPHTFQGDSKFTIF